MTDPTGAAGTARPASHENADSTDTVDDNVDYNEDNTVDETENVVLLAENEHSGPDRVHAEDEHDADVTAQIEQPAKVMRIGTMIKQLLEEVRAAPLDEAGRQRLKEIHQSSIRELEDGLSDDLRAELDRLTLPFAEDHIPSEAELRIAQAQLVGWLEGLFHGVQTALFAQQMAARAQLEQMRGRALPGQIGPAGGLPPGVVITPGDTEHGTGQYL